MYTIYTMTADNNNQRKDGRQTYEMYSCGYRYNEFEEAGGRKTISDGMSLYQADK